MDLMSRDGHLFQQKKSGHPCVAPGVFGGDAAFVTPEYVRLAPRYPILEKRLCQEFVGPLRGMSTGEGHAESATILAGKSGLPDEKPGCS